MNKSYLRFEPSSAFGVVASAQCNTAYNWSGDLALTGCCQDVGVWNLREGSKVAKISSEMMDYPYSVQGLVCVICSSPDKKTCSAGYSSGEIRIIDYHEKKVKATLRGHRTRVSVLTYGHNDGAILASGSLDCDVIVWDVVASSALCRLRGHKGAITGIVFLSRSTQQFVVTSSTDTLLKVWDLSTRHCVQTVVGHRAEIWSLALVPIGQVKPDSSSSGAEAESSYLLLLTGSADEFIRGYMLTHDSHVETPVSTEVLAAPLVADTGDVLRYIGSVQRDIPSGAASNNCTGFSSSKNCSILSAQTNGKIVEIYKLRSVEEGKKKMKRRLKRTREKETRRKAEEGTTEASNTLSVWNTESRPPETTSQDDPDSSGSPNRERVILEDLLEYSSHIRAPQKVKSAVFHPSSPKDCKERLLLSLVSNCLEVYQVTSSPGAVAEAHKQSIVDSQGHRSDVRAVAITRDGSTIASCGSDSVKVWSSKTERCSHTCKSGYGVCITFVPGERFVVVGTKDGELQIIDTQTSILVADVDAHEGAVWSVSVRPDGKGLMSASADRLVKFWNFVGDEDAEKLGTVAHSSTLSLKLVRELEMSQDALCAAYSKSSGDKLMVAVGTQDHTVKVFFDDSLKFFLSLYGHKLPVMCLDISYDSSILVSGSADKTLKVWGLDFGDCHRSLLGHEESVTCVRFQRETKDRLFFSGDKAGVIKYWDADKFEQILNLPGHDACVWGLAVAHDGALAVSVGQDRSIRLWSRSQDLVFLEEEREREIEALVEQDIDRDDKVVGSGAQVEDATAAGRRSLESVRGGERLMEVLDIVENELAEIEVYEKSSGSDNGGGLGRRTANPVMLGMVPHKFMLHSLRQVKLPDLEQALLVLPFTYVERLVRMLLELARKSLDLELTTRCCIFLVRVHHAQIATTHALVTEMQELQSLLLHAVGAYREMVGSNIAGLSHMRRALEEKRSAGLLPDDAYALASVSAESRKRKKSKG
jgi:U3 small nucleolar RNA-associated protein 12